MPNVRVKPGDAGVTHDIRLSDGDHEWGITLADGARGIQEAPATPSNLRITGGGTKFGDYDPMMSHIEQRDWSGGRGLEYFVDDPTRYLDSLYAWTLTAGKLMPAPQWQMSSGYVADDGNYPGNVTWKSLLGNTRFQAVPVTAGSTSYTDARDVWLWLRKIGTPGTLTAITCSSRASDHPSSLAGNTTTLGASEVPGPESEWHKFTFSSDIAVSTAAGGTVFIKVSGAATDNVANHWEIGADSSGNSVWTSSNGASGAWSSAGWKPYYRIKKNLNKGKWHFVRFSDPKDFYAICQYASSATASELYKCSTTGNPAWSSITASGTALTGAVEDVTVMDKIGLAARGSTVAIWGFRIDSSGTGIQGSTMGSTAGADKLHTFYDPVDGPQIWKAMSTGIAYRAKTVAWGSTLVWTPSTGIPVGDKAQPIIGFGDWNDQIYARKRDSLWGIKNDRAAKQPVGIGAVVETSSWSPLVAKDLFLYFPWSYSLERLYNGTLDDVGPWKGAGMPSSRAGPISCLEPGIGWLFAGIDGGSTGYSCVMAYDGTGWHEIYRCQHVGGRVQNLHLQPVSGGRTRLWISVDGDLIYVQLPLNTLNPLRDPTFPYQHEFSLITATIDMGVSQLPKLFHSLHVIADNLGTNREVWVDYQLDDDIGSSSWSPLLWRNFSPESEFKINRGDKKAIRFRIRGVSNVATTPVVVNATVMEGLARTPVKRQWTIRLTASSFQVTRNGLPDTKPDDLYRWIQDASTTVKPLLMQSRWPWMHNVYVFAEAPTVSPSFITPTGEHGEVYTITLREA